MEKAGWLAGWLLMPDLVVGCRAILVFHLQTPPNCHVIETPKGELLLPRTLSPSSLLALDYLYYHLTFAYHITFSFASVSFLLASYNSQRNPSAYFQS